MPTPYAYTQRQFLRIKMKRHEIARKAISLCRRAIEEHGKTMQKPLKVLIIPWSEVRILLGPNDLQKMVLHGGPTQK